MATDDARLRLARRVAYMMIMGALNTYEKEGAQRLWSDLHQRQRDRYLAIADEMIAEMEGRA